MSRKPSKIKRNFWILAAFFGFLTVSGLMLAWSNPSPFSHHSVMMGSTMGSMMRSEVGVITLSNLFTSGESVNNSMSSHHQGGGLMAKIHFATTCIIVICLPIILGGIVLLAVIWI